MEKTKYVLCGLYAAFSVSVCIDFICCGLYWRDTKDALWHAGLIILGFNMLSYLLLIYTVSQIKQENCQNIW